jgi:hypothetical protein
MSLYLLGSRKTLNFYVVTGALPVPWIVPSKLVTIPEILDKENEGARKRTIISADEASDCFCLWFKLPTHMYLIKISDGHGKIGML